MLPITVVLGLSLSESAIADIMQCIRYISDERLGRVWGCPDRRTAFGSSTLRRRCVIDGNGI